MHLRLVGTSFKTAPLELRERLHVDEADLVPLLKALEQRPLVRECFVLSTCNRVELLAHLETATPGEAQRNGCVLTDFLATYHSEDRDYLRSYLYTFDGPAAVTHTFRVASSLDSMVIGEPQIVAQVREALAAAREAGTIGPVLGPVLDRALAVAKKVRTETAIGRNAVSISYAAVELARKIFGDLDGRSALLVGAGEMSELAARHLVKHGVAELSVANRSAEAALRMATRFEANVIPWDEHLEALNNVDIVITSTASPEPLIRADAVREIMPKRRHRMLFFIDIAVPRDVDPKVNEIDNVYLYDVDDLQGVVAENRAARKRAAAEAERLIAEEAQRFVGSMLAQQIGPAIVELREQAERLRQRELVQVRQRLGELTPEQEKTLDDFTRGFTKRLLHGSITELKRAARLGRGVDVAGQLNNRDDPDD